MTVLFSLILLVLFSQIKLADKQAAVESLDWQTREANNKVEKLQAETDSKNFEISAFMKFFQELMKNTTSTAPLVEETVFDTFDHLPNIVSSRQDCF